MGYRSDLAGCYAALERVAAQKIPSECEDICLLCFIVDEGGSCHA